MAVNMWARQRCACMSVVYSRSILSAIFNAPIWSAFSWNKIRCEQVMWNEWRVILYYSQKIISSGKVSTQHEDEEDEKGNTFMHIIHFHLPLVPLHKKSETWGQNYNMILWHPRLWGYPGFFIGSFTTSIVTQCLKNYSSETFWLCRR